MRQEGKKEKMIARKFKQAPRVKKHNPLELCTRKLTRGNLGNKSLSLRDLWNRLEACGEFLVVDGNDCVLGLIQRADVFEYSFLHELAFGIRRFRLIQHLREFQRWQRREWFGTVLPAQDDVLKNWWKENRETQPFDYEKASWNKEGFERAWHDYFVARYRQDLNQILFEIAQTRLALRMEAPSKMRKGRNDFWESVDELSVKNERLEKQIAENFDTSVFFNPESVFFEYQKSGFYFVPRRILQEIGKVIDENFSTRERAAAMLGREPLIEPLLKNSAIYQWKDSEFLQSLTVDWKISAALKKEVKRVKALQREKKRKEKEQEAKNVEQESFSRICMKADAEIERIRILKNRKKYGG